MCISLVYIIQMQTIYLRNGDAVCLLSKGNEYLNTVQMNTQRQSCMCDAGSNQHSRSHNYLNTKKRQYCARREFQLREKIQMSTRGGTVKLSFQFYREYSSRKCGGVVFNDPYIS